MIIASVVPMASMFLLTIGYYLLKRDFRMAGVVGKAYYDGLSMMLPYSE